MGGQGGCVRSVLRVLRAAVVAEQLRWGSCEPRSQDLPSIQGRRLLPWQRSLHSYTRIFVLDGIDELLIGPDRIEAPFEPRRYRPGPTLAFVGCCRT